MADDLVYTADEIAKLLKCRKHYVYDLMNKGFLPYLNLGSKKVYKRDLINFIEKHVGKDLRDLDNIRDIEH